MGKIKKESEVRIQESEYAMAEARVLKYEKILHSAPQLKSKAVLPSSLKN
jgi:hypothetical protein